VSIFIFFQKYPQCSLPCTYGILCYHVIQQIHVVFFFIVWLMLSHSNSLFIKHEESRHIQVKQQFTPTYVYDFENSLIVAYVAFWPCYWALRSNMPQGSPYPHNRNKVCLQCTCWCVCVCVFWSFRFYEMFETCVICLRLKYMVNYNTFVVKTST
jgi:hypothetical protein